MLFAVGSTLLRRTSKIKVDPFSQAGLRLSAIFLRDEVEDFIDTLLKLSSHNDVARPHAIEMAFGVTPAW